MKVLWLAPFPYINDGQSHPAPWITTLAKALLAKGIDLTILSYNANIEVDIVKKEFEGIQLIYIRAPRIKKDLLTFYRIRINKVKQYLYAIIDSYDLLHIHGSELQYEVIGADMHIPTLISIQGIISEVVKVVPLYSHLKQFASWKLSSIYEKKYLTKYKYFLCRTHWDTNYIKSINPKAEIYNIWEMIREDFFGDHFSDEKINILFVGGASPIKGLAELLQAFNASLQQKGLRLIILGSCDVSDLNEIIKKHHLVNIDLNNIECRGVQDVNGMIKAYEESFCLVHPSYIDNSPNSVCEAQVSGLPVIATDVGGVASLIDNEKTGLLIGRKSQDIEFAVDKLLKDDELRKKISKKSREIARKRHDSNSILEETIRIYKDMVGNN